MRVVGEQQDLRRGRQHEQDADQRFLHLGPPALGPGEQQRAAQRRGHGGELRRPARQLVAERVRRDHAERGDLRDREVDEHDAALQHLLPERHVREHYQQAGEQRRPQDAQVDCEVAHFSTASSRSMVSSNSPNRSLAPGVPPTENGRVTTGACTRSESQSAAFGSL